MLKLSISDVDSQKDSNGDQKQHFFGLDYFLHALLVQKYKGRTQFRKCVCEIRRNKVLELENASVYLDPFCCYTPLYKRGIKQKQNRPKETNVNPI